MLKTNYDRLPRLTVQASVAPLNEPPWDLNVLTADGTGIRMAVSGGICTNVRVGDPVYHVLGSHIVPGVCLSGPGGKDGILAAYAPCGTKLVTMDEKKTEGYVLGKCPHTNAPVCAAFPAEAISAFTGDERFLLHPDSVGLVLEDWPEIFAWIDHALLMKLPVREEEGKLLFPVAKILPEKFAGQLGGDMLSVMSRDEEAFQEYRLDELRFGDFVMFTDIDATFGTAYLEGAVTIGIITDGDAPNVGGGPEVAPILSCKRGLLGGYVSEMGNVGKYFEEG